jgi:ABC-type Fe3+-hydroxamate transport system substrate-binding protein
MSSSPTALTRRAALALPLIAALPRSAQAAIVITDALELAKPAERVVIAFYLEEFTAIGGKEGWDRVVGFRKHQWVVNRAKTYERFVAAIPRLDALPDVGLGENEVFVPEKVLALKPDLLIVPPWAMSGSDAQIGAIEAAGVPVLVADYNAQNLDKHVASTIAIGQAIGAEPRARELATLYADKVADIRRRAGLSKGPKPKVYIEIGWLGPNEFGSTYKNTMWGRMLDLIGADNIANEAMAQAAGFVPIAPEKVLAAAPEHIFITGSSWANRPSAVRLGYDVDLETARSTLRPYLARPGWDALPAVRAGNVYTVEHSLVRSLTDWISLQFIAKQLYPDQFADVDPVASLREFHERFLPVPFAGTWMGRL